MATTQSSSNDKTLRWLNAMSGHVLRHGLNNASLRPLAKAAGTSDRMLIYHFGNKDGVISALLTHLADQFLAGLSASGTDRAPTRAALVTDIMAQQRHPDMAGFTGIWFDIIAAAAQGNSAHHTTGREIINEFLRWIETRLPDDDPNPQDGAKAVLTLIEGMAVMDALGQTPIGDAAMVVLLLD